jgi:hypothetical protein
MAVPATAVSTRSWYPPVSPWFWEFEKEEGNPPPREVCKDLEVETSSSVVCALPPSLKLSSYKLLVLLWWAYLLGTCKFDLIWITQHLGIFHLEKVKRNGRFQFLWVEIENPRRLKFQLASGSVHGTLFHRKAWTTWLRNCRALFVGEPKNLLFLSKIRDFFPVCPGFPCLEL